MRRLGILATFLVCSSAFGSAIWFDPPDPASRTPVTAHVTVSWNGCRAKTATVQRRGTQISIDLDIAQGCSDRPDTAVDLGVLPAGIYDVLVGPGNLLVLIAQAKLVVRDADPQATVSPNVISHAFEPITVTGAGIAPCLTSPCSIPVVKFGDQAVNVTKRIDDNTVVVESPLHQPGILDVIVTDAVGQTKRATAALDYFADSGPFDPAFFEPVLFPVMISGPGAFGSVWSTEATLRNENDFAVPAGPVAAHATTVLKDANAAAGYLFIIPRDAAPKLWFGTLVKDLSRQSQALGTEIPVVRENDFFDRPFQILDVPADARYRVALRAYRLDAVNTMKLRVLPLDSNDPPLVDEVVSLNPVNAGGTFSAVAITDLVAEYPHLAGKGPLRIELDAQSAERVAWAFVSITNNETQHVTVLQPQ